MALGWDSIQRIYQLSPSNSDDEEDASLSAFFGPFFRHKRGTGRAFPTKFTPPTDSITPTELFRPTVLNQFYIRYIHQNDPRAMLILTDGACLGNGQPDPRAGWAFVHGPGRTGQPLIVSGRLESKGPFDDESTQSSNRAELRAVIAALRFRFWPGEGFNSLTIATDSEYVVEGSTNWAKTWIQNDWKTAGGADVKNRDLWEMLLGEVEKLNAGLAIRFWKIPREWNEVADGAAKRAAEEDRVSAEWTTSLGVL